MAAPEDGCPPPKPCLFSQIDLKPEGKQSFKDQVQFLSQVFDSCVHLRKLRHGSAGLAQQLCPSSESGSHDREAANEMQEK